MTRAYTVEELDALRKIVENKWTYGSYVVPKGTVILGPVVTCQIGGGPGVITDPHFRPSTGRAYIEAERDCAVEEIVRTHMLAGHTAQDLLDSEKNSAALDKLVKS